MADQRDPLRDIREPRKGACAVPLSELCKECSTYTEQLDHARNWTCAKVLGGRATTGKCGNYSFIFSEGPLVYSVSYFDSSGKLVAAYRESDVVDQKCAGAYYFGPAVTCKVEDSKNLCTR
jgi:hypothetical protein